jgi:hypothetical protein
MVLARGALAHPTGYPVYTMLGHAFCVAAHAAGASWELAAALWSAIGGGFAAYFFFRLADRLLGDGPGRLARLAIVTAATILFTLNPMVSFETTHAEVYSWHLAWALGTTILFVHAMTVVLGGEDPGTRGVARVSAWWGLLCGLGLAHHTTSVLVSGPMTLALLARLTARWPRRLPAAALGLATALAGLAPYGFVFWRISHGDAADWLPFERTFQGAINHITSKQYEWVIGDYQPSAVQREWLAWWIYPFLFPGLALVAIAAILAPRGAARGLAFWTLFAVAVANVVFTFRLRVDDPSSYFLTPLALGTAALAPVAARLAAIGAGRLAKAVPAAVLAAGLVAGGSWLKTGFDRRATMIEADGRIREMWDRIPDGPGVLFWENDMFHRLRAFQVLDGQKTALEIWESDGFQYAHLRAGFIQRTGVDPLAGLDEILHGGVTQKQSQEGVHDNVNRKTALPVYEFLPEVGSVRMLRKPARSPESR